MSRDAVAFEAMDDADVRKPGAYRFIGRHGDDVKIGIIHACPCGCGGRGAIYFRGLGHPGATEWDVHGEWPKVTLTPSIGVKYDGNGNGPFTSPYHWHGFLTDGVFKEQ